MNYYILIKLPHYFNRNYPYLFTMEHLILKRFFQDFNSMDYYRDLNIINKRS